MSLKRTSLRSFSGSLLRHCTAESKGQAVHSGQKLRKAGLTAGDLPASLLRLEAASSDSAAQQTRITKNHGLLLNRPDGSLVGPLKIHPQGLVPDFHPSLIVDSKKVTARLIRYIESNICVKHGCKLEDRVAVCQSIHIQDQVLIPPAG